MKIIYEDNALLLKAIKNESNKCLISFTGVGHAMGGIDVQKEEFVGSALSHGNCFFITDKQRSWANNLDLSILKKEFLRWSDNRFHQIIGIGNSMGASNAMLLGPELGASTIICFTPQFSVHPRVFPVLENPKWVKWRDNILQWKYETVEHNQNNFAREFIFHGGTPSEIEHALKFKKKTNRTHYLIKDSGHDVAMHFKKMGCLGKIIDSCMLNQDASIFSSILNKHYIDHLQL